jgi:hypothetical protein
MKIKTTIHPTRMTPPRTPPMIPPSAADDRPVPVEAVEEAVALLAAEATLLGTDS